MIASAVGDHALIVVKAEAQVTDDSAVGRQAGRVDGVLDGAGGGGVLGHDVEVAQQLAVEHVVEHGGVDILSHGGDVDLQAAVAKEEGGPGRRSMLETLILGSRWVVTTTRIDGKGYIDDVPVNSGGIGGVDHGDTRGGHRNGDGGHDGHEDELQTHGAQGWEEFGSVQGSCWMG